VDLHVEPSGPRVRAGLEAALRDGVRSGRLAPGSRLPSSRSLAADLGVARNTVADAYGQLVAEGWLVARQGSGTRVADRAATAEAATPPPGAQPRGPRYDLRPGSPDVSRFPRDRWLAAARRAVNNAPAAAFGYGDPRGLPELRVALAEYLARARGVAVSPDRVVVCSGFTQGLALVCRVLRDRGATSVAMESYGVLDHRDIAAAAGLRVVPLQVDDDGAQVGAARALAADAVLLTPAHQFPLGMALAPARRTRVLDWAADSGALVIEDDYDGEFRYDRQPVGALQALARERVVYGGTASKSVAPGLRLGWLVLPADLVDDVVSAKSLADRSSSSLDQLVLADFLTSGEYDRQVRRSRLAYRRRRDRLLDTVNRRVSGASITGIAAGLHALLHLPNGQTEDDVVGRATEHGLAVEGLSSYDRAAGRHGAALVVGYGTPPDHAFTGALARLVAVLNQR
jgi:GntR family transcriptional regulator/MocR family aminotransferase